MSLGIASCDNNMLAQLAWKAFQEAVQACGEEDELTCEIASLHKVLLRLSRENKKPESLPHIDDDRRQELDELCNGCEHVLNIMDSIMAKYNALSGEERTGKRLWRRVRFGNGEVQDVMEIRSKLSAYTSAILISLNLCSLGALGRSEHKMNDLMGDLKGLRWKTDWAVALMAAKNTDRNVWSYYMNDVGRFWTELRRELVKEGYERSILHDRKHLIKLYIQELGNRAVFEEAPEDKAAAPQITSRISGSRPYIPISRSDEVDDTLPESPRTPKYLRFDKRIHIGSINPRAMNARSPEQQAAHDKHKEEKRARSAGVQEDNEQRKTGHTRGKAKHKPRIVYVA